jgi:hypothetical protein
VNTNSNYTTRQNTNGNFDGEIEKDIMNVNYLQFDNLKVNSEKENLDHTCQSDSRTLTSSAFSEHKDEDDKIIKDASEMLEKEFLSKKRGRKIKKKCK